MMKFFLKDEFISKMGENSQNIGVNVFKVDICL
jgi:hypothetical protein